MRTFVGIVLMVIGTPIALLGILGAVYVGPDDTVTVVDDQVTAETSVVTADASLISITGPTLHVTVDGGEQETFVGAAHPVHVGSYLDSVAYTRISDAGWQATPTLTPESGEADAPATAPGELDWWRASSEGTGEQHIDVALTDEPFNVVIASTGLDAPVDVQLTAEGEIDWLFVAVVVVAAVGLVFLVVGLLLFRSGRRRKRRRERPEEQGTDTDERGADDDTSELPVQEGDGGETSSQTPPADPPERPGRLARLRWFPAGLGVLTLTSCAALPDEADHAAHASVPAITSEAASDFFERYTEVNNEANAEQDAELIETVETGTLLTSTRMSYEIQQAQDRDPIEPFTIQPRLVAAPEFDAYPMWFLAMSESEGDQSSPGYHLVTRADASSPWLVTLAMYPSVDATVPEPLSDDGVATVAGSELAAQGDEVLNALVNYAETGEEPEGVDLSEAGGVSILNDHGLDIVEGPEDPVSVEQECSLRDDDVHWLATGSGALGMAAIGCTQDVTIEDDFSIALGEEGYGTIPGDTELSAMSFTHGVTFLVHVGDDGSAAVYGEGLLPYAMDYSED